MDREQYEFFISKLFLDMLEDLGVTIASDTAILDFGCGEGWVVYQLRKKGLRAFGADIVDRSEHVQKLCRDEDIAGPGETFFGVIDTSNYRIPYDDNTFDIVISDQVFEHVKNWPEALAEIKRVLKPGGVSLHIFPSRYRPLEPHIYVPWAGIIQKRAYLAFWAWSGVRNPSQQQWSWKKVLGRNVEYLTRHTNYLRKEQIRKNVCAQFEHIAFVEDKFIKHHHFGRIHRYLYFMSSKWLFISALFSTFHTRVIFFRKALHP